MVSSTISDLPSEREAAYRAIRSLGSMYEPLMSEKTFGALNKPSKEACIETVKKCDLLYTNHWSSLWIHPSSPLKDWKVIRFLYYEIR